jgi:hypothetical protein
MATDKSDTSVRDQRQADMGSDEGAQEKRRQIQKIVRAGDEEAIPILLETVNEYLAVPLRSSEAKSFLPAAMAAADGLGKLCNIGETEAEDLLVRALDGSNRLQCAAADALGVIGSSKSVANKLETMSRGPHQDKSAAVRARAKIAFRRMERRSLASEGGTIGKVQTYDELLAIVKQACEQLTAANPNFKQVDRLVPENQRLGKIEKIPNLFEVELEPSEGRKQKVYILIGNMVVGRGQETSISVEDKRAGLFDDRALAMGINIHSNYIVLFTPFCRAGRDPKPYSQSLELNALRLEPDKHKTSTNFSFFTKGAIGIYDLQGITGPQGAEKKEFCMLETLPIDDVSLDAIRRSVQVLAFTGDELEKEHRTEGSE